MRVAVLALTLALVASHQVNFVPEFPAGNTYVYQYEAQLLGGLPEEGLARAGVKISSKVLISEFSQNTFLLKLLDPMLSEYSGIWPNDPFIPATKLTTALAAQLLTPIKFEYTNGAVGKIYAPAGVSATVLNVFRGLLNILQLNIKRTQTMYEMQEAGTQGVCNTQYVISEDEKAERIDLIKTKNLNQCQERIMKDIGMAYMERCVECEKRGALLRGTASYKYNIKPTATGGLILKATVTELHQFAPVDNMITAVQMEAKQALIFIETVKAAIVPVAGYIHRGSVQFELAPEMLRTPLQLIKITNPEAQAVEILQHLVTYNMAEVHHDAPMKFVELVQLLREARWESIEAIWAQHKARPVFRRWILEAMPAVGTSFTLRFIKEKFIAREITIAEAIPSLLASVHMVTPDMESLQLVENLAMNHIENPALRAVAMLGYGTLVAKFCTQNPTCPIELVKPIHDLIPEAVAKGDFDQLGLHLKVLGNAGHPGSFKIISKLLPGFGSAAATMPMGVHADALCALRNIAKKQPRQVQELAVQLFMNKALHPELRMLTCIVLFETKPAMALVMSLANILMTETNLQVVSFTYSHMKALTRSTAPDYAAVAAACNVAVKILSPKLDRLSNRYSRAIYLDHYYSPLMMGAAASAFYINDAASILPKAVVAKARAYLAGAAADVIEVGINTAGLQEALLKIPNAPAHADRITKMRRALQTLSEWRTYPANKPLASMYVKLFGQEVAFANIDKAIIEQAIAFATGPALGENIMSAFRALVAGISVQYAMPMLVSEVRRILPTAVGLPMELSLYSAAVATAVVEVKAIVRPALPDTFSVAQFLTRDIMLEAAVKPSIAIHTFAVLGVNTEFIQAALIARAKVNTILPAKMAARLDIAAGNFKFEILPVVAPSHVADASFETFAVARNIADLPAERITPMIPAQSVAYTSRESTSRMAASLAGSMSKSSEIIASMEQADMKPIIKAAPSFVQTFCNEAIGLKGCLEVSSTFLKDSPLYFAIGKHSVIAVVKPVEGEAVEKLEMEIQVGPKAAEKIIKQITLGEEEIVEAIPVLKKLKKILVPGQKIGARSSSSSSSSHSSSSSRAKSSSRSLSSSRSSSSSSRSRLSKAEVFIHTFKKDHQKQTAISQARSQARVSRSKSSAARSQARVSRSKSSAASFEAIYQQTKFLGSAVGPLVTIIARAVRADRRMEGYQITAYLDKPKYRVQIIAASLIATDKWMVCVDGVVLSKHKVNAKLAWGVECREYNTMMTAETGLMGADPAARFRVSWDRLPEAPRFVRRYAMFASKYIPYAVAMAGLIEKSAQNSERQISLTLVATSEKTFDIFMKSPKETMYRKAINFPIAVPINEITGLSPFDDNIVNQIHYLFSKATAVQCSMDRDMLTTFNSRSYKNEMPLSCYQVLAQDCTPELKFMVLLKKDLTLERNHINVKIADIDIDLYPMENEVLVKVNGLAIPLANLPYQHPSGTIQIKQNAEGLSLYAPSHGLHEVYFDAKSWKIKVVDWMKGQTCGLCGKADGEIRQEYRTPNGRLTKSTVSFAHSWVVPSESCRDATECYIKLESVKLEKQMIVHGVESKCYSVEPVLRCLPGCLAVRTTPVIVGFHCLPVDSPLNRPEGLANIYEKSVDVREATEAHVACRCTAQCS